MQGVIIGPGWSKSRCLFWNIYFRKKAKTERKPWCRQASHIILSIVAVGKKYFHHFFWSKGAHGLFLRLREEIYWASFFSSANGQLVVWGLVVWIPGIPWWKGWVLRGTFGWLAALRFANFPIKPPNLASQMPISAGSFDGHKKNSVIKVCENLCHLLFRWYKGHIKSQHYRILYNVSYH